MAGRNFGVMIFLLLAGCAAPYPGEPTYQEKILSQASHPPAAWEAGSPAWASGADVTTPAHGAAVDAAREDQTYSLDQCIETALAGQRGVRMAERRILMAEDRVDEIIANAMPKLTATIGWDKRDNDQGSSLGGATVVTSDREHKTANVSLVVPLYTFGRVSNWHHVGLLGVRASEYQAQQVRDDVAWAVSQAYFRLLEARKIRGVVEDSIAVMKRQQGISRDFLAQGLVAKNDLLAVEVQLASRQQELIQARNNIELATAALNRLMGVDIHQATQVADVLEASPWNGSYAVVLQAAIDNRPDLASLKTQVDMARAEYRATRSDLAPQLYAFGNYNYIDDEHLLNKDWISGGIAMEFPLFDGGVTYARLRQKKKLIAEKIDLHDERVDDIILEVKQAYLMLREARERIPVAQKAIALGEENLRMVRDQYTQGLVSSADVLTEEERLSRVRSAYFQALYGYQTALARLKNLAGGTLP